MPADYLDDDYDPLAPPTSGEGAEADAPVDEWVDDALDVPVPVVADPVDDEPDDGEGDESLQDEAGAADGGLGDGRGIVRLWLEDGRLVRVRLSPVWHTKVAPEKLTEVFAGVLAKGATVAEVGDFDPAASDEEVDFDRLPALTPQLQQAFERRLSDLERRWGAAVAADEADDAEPPMFWGRSQGALVRVDASGSTVAVEFDPQWLKATHAGVVARQVVAAAARAHERAADRDGEPTELDRLAVEFRVMRLAYEAMARKAAQGVQ